MNLLAQAAAPIKPFTNINSAVGNTGSSNIGGALNQSSDINTQASDFFAFKDLGSLFSTGLSAAITISAALLLIMFVYGGIRWLGSAGEKNELEGAQKTLTASVIGFAIVALAWAIFLFVKNFFGLGEAIITD